MRLQQVAGRDRKVDIKPFAIQGLLTSILPTQLLTENAERSPGARREPQRAER